jgi:hypothetical protein
MIYQWGQAYVSAEWSRSDELTVSEPVSWAFMQNDNRRDAGRPLGAPDPAGQHRLLEEIYPPVLRQGFATALPHRMQTDAPIAMIARTSARKDTFWWASGRMSEASAEFRRYFGAGLLPSSSAAGRKRAACMLLVSGADAVVQAACFGQYLAPPKAIARQGELDLTDPGDADSDGFVESYGFQAIRLANGRATFRIYPQERPIFFPAYLFTVPAAERETLDLKNSRMLVTIDGKLYADPPQFPDGSFLLQIPHVIDQPADVEAVVVRK